MGTLAVRLALGLLFLSFFFDAALVMDFSKSYQIAQFSQDEFWFLEEIDRLQTALLRGDFVSIRAFGSPFAYGFSFWLMASIVALPLKGHLMIMTLFLRLFSLSLKYATFWVVFRRSLQFTQRPLFSLVLLTLLLAVPGFVFDGKIIGPEFLLMLLVTYGWSCLFEPSRRSQTVAGFCFALAATIKINLAPLCILFPLVWLFKAKIHRRNLLLDWLTGAVVPLALFVFPADPFREIFGISATHHVDWGFVYLADWYTYNALEFDDMLKGGWAVDFLSAPMLLVLAAVGLYLHLSARKRDNKQDRSESLLIISTFAAAFFVCCLTSLTSLLHPWFIFAPFLLLLTCAVLLASNRNFSTTIATLFLVCYCFAFGPRYFERWQHRIDKFESVQASEEQDFKVASWIAEKCPKAREAVIDYNLLWPNYFNGNLHKMWTLIEVEDVRRLSGDASPLLQNVDLLLLKQQRVLFFFGPKVPNGGGVSGAALGRFFPPGPPFFTHVKDFANLSVFARQGTCNDQPPAKGAP